jgi:hypothetical protein
VNREDELRRYLQAHHPEIRFATGPPTDACIFFGNVAATPETLVPVAHPFTLWDRSAHLDDHHFGQFLLGLSRLIEVVYDLTDGQAENWAEDTLAEARSTLVETDADLELVLTSCWAID